MTKRRYIILPVGTVVNTAAVSTVVQIYEEQIGSIHVDSSHNVVINTTVTATGNSLAYAVPSASTASAYSFMQQIQNFFDSDMTGGFTPQVYVAAGPTFASVVPNAVSVGMLNQYQVFGANFLLSGINAMKLDDGLGDVFTMGVGIVDDMGMETTAVTITAAATYTLYYSTNGGSSWTTTGLTVVAS